MVHVAGHEGAQACLLRAGATAALHCQASSATSRPRASVEWLSPTTCRRVQGTGSRANGDVAGRDGTGEEHLL